jgi:uncharacterized membrane protein
MKKRSIIFAVISTIVLIGLLFIPLNGDFSNKFAFFLGRFHPIILHLPIGALMALFFMELINGLRPKLNLESACNILLWFSVISIIPTLFLGFLLGSTGSYDDELLNSHKWLGWFTALVCVWMVVIREKKSISTPYKVSSFYKIFLFVNVLLLTLAGHYGGYLTHGEDYLTKYMPIAMKKIIGLEKDNKGVMRRLTKRQYTISLNELLGVSVDFGDVLPDDGKSKMGFSNNGNILQTSSLHLDYYQKIAREALDKAIVFWKKPEAKHYRVKIGKNIGNGISGAEFRGYQTAPIKNENILVEILNSDGNPIKNSKNSKRGFR